MAKENKDQNLGTKIQGTLGNYSNIISPIAQGINTISPAFTQMNNTASAQSLGIRDSISSAAISSGNPIAMAIGAAAKIVDAIGDATTANTILYRLKQIEDTIGSETTDGTILYRIKQLEEKGVLPSDDQS